MTSGCPNCSYSGEYAGLHWKELPDHRPEFTEEQLEILTGVLMGDGTVGHSGKNPRIIVVMTNKKYLEYLFEQFPILSSNVSVHLTEEECQEKARDVGFVSNPENCSEQYVWRTKCHPSLNRFSGWYRSGEKVWPNDIEMTPTTLKHLYCCDGDKKNGLGGRSDYIRIGLYNERDRLSNVIESITDAGLPEPRVEKSDNNCQICWSVEDSKQVLSYMGDPLPGFEYKW